MQFTALRSLTQPCMTAYCIHHNTYDPPWGRVSEIQSIKGRYAEHAGNPRKIQIQNFCGGRSRCPPQKFPSDGRPREIPSKADYTLSSIVPSTSSVPGSVGTDTDWCTACAITLFDAASPVRRAVCRHRSVTFSTRRRWCSG